MRFNDDEGRARFEIAFYVLHHEEGIFQVMKDIPHNDHVQITDRKIRIVCTAEYDLHISQTFLPKNLKRTLIDIIRINFPAPTDHFH